MSDMATLEAMMRPADATTTPAAPRRRARGLRMPVLPSWPLLAQLGGAAGALTGCYLQWGLAVTLIVGGVVSVAVGMLREAGKI